MLVNGVLKVGHFLNFIITLISPVSQKLWQRLLNIFHFYFFLDCLVYHIMEYVIT